MILTPLLAGSGLRAQVAGYRVGTKHLDIRAMPCEPNDGDMLCRPNGDVYLRIRLGTLMEIDTSFYQTDTACHVS
jgi:hypothetical protein